jgi:hypothetical protein
MRFVILFSAFFIINLLCASINETAEVFMFSFFTDGGRDGLHLAYSNDGYDWETLNSNLSFLRPVIGKDSLMRDPCIISGADGRFHMV